MKLKRIVFIFAVVLLLAACAHSRTVEILESPQENYPINEMDALNEVQIPTQNGVVQNTNPHHYGSFDRIEYSQAAASRMFYETTFEGLRERAPNIVRGRMADDARILLEFNDMSRPNQPSGGVNIVSFEIYEVIKGNQISVGETIRIIEPYYIYNGVFHSRGRYMPSTPHQEYIFFLASQHVAPWLDGTGLEDMVGAFWTLHGERSRFPVPASGQNLDEIDFGLGSRANVEIYMSILQEVLDAFV